MPHEFNVFSKKLKKIREDFGMNQKEFANYIGVHPATIGRYEKNQINATAAAIKSISEKLNINPGWFLGWTDDKYKDIAPPGRMIPVLGTIAAGKPILAEEYIESYECVEIQQSVDYCLKVKGDSMIGARIYDGDIVFIRKQEMVENGEIAAVLIDEEEATLKRLYRINGSVILRSENPHIPERVFTKSETRNVKILGKAIWLKGEVR